MLLKSGVIDFDAGSGVAFAEKAHVDAAGVGGIRLWRAARADLPGDGDVARWFPDQHVAPGRARAVAVDFVPVAAGVDIEGGADVT